MIGGRLLWLAATVLAPSAFAQDQSAGAPASAPDRSAMRASTEKAVRDVLLLPKAARFEWPAGFKQGSWRPYNSRAVTGWVTCGIVYARDKFGYERGRVFVAVVQGKRAFADLDSQPGGPVERGCSAMRFPPPDGSDAIASPR